MVKDAKFTAGTKVQVIAKATPDWELNGESIDPMFEGLVGVVLPDPYENPLVKAGNWVLVEFPELAEYDGFYPEELSIYVEDAV